VPCCLSSIASNAIPTNFISNRRVSVITILRELFDSRIIHLFNFFNSSYRIDHLQGISMGIGYYLCAKRWGNAIVTQITRENYCRRRKRRERTKGLIETKQLRRLTRFFFGYLFFPRTVILPTFCLPFGVFGPPECHVTGNGSLAARSADVKERDHDQNANSHALVQTC